ncbi:MULTISPECIES: pilus assembly PilX family protein [unclassified Variovorax]|uniref:pilus assembly PilX family protein n=1 Tax=unclassified Variovorax TaxID=663243 RepID=UPI001317C736|nr:MULTISPECIES: PilX N-terminal domain-containing pilus assembly protein [unclassified Variovorax]VTU18508.1 Tfp pilus assembly protein PilX [Variovorax sp. SRS16]VTU26713.1 Tfp pilus assembly protein PilX [Variovorax sp. PBL-E5]
MQRGVVLIMSLVLLIIISLVAVLAVQRATSEEQVSKALRTNTVAFQAAEAALRYCEDQMLKSGGVQSGTTIVPPNPDPLDGTKPSLWADRANWEPSANKAIQVDAAQINSSDAAARALPMLPRCMVESTSLQGESARRPAFLITAVGFSADFHTTAGKPDAGGEVWLQSLVTPGDK